MDRQDTYRNLLIAFGVFLIVWYVGESLLPSVPPPGSTKGEGTPVAKSVGSDSQADSGSPTSTSPTFPDGAEEGADIGHAIGGRRDRRRADSDLFTVKQVDEVLSVAMGSDEAVGKDQEPSKSPYRMRLVLSNVGASIELATITDHAEALKKPERYALLSKVEDGEGGWLYSLAVEKINLDDEQISLGQAKWNVEGWPDAKRTYKTSDGQQEEEVRFFVDIEREGEPLIRLTRRYRLPQQARESGRHDLYVDLTVENLSEQPHEVVIAYCGGVGVRSTSLQLDGRAIDVGVEHADGRVEGRRTGLGSVEGKKHLPVFPPSSATTNSFKLAWAATVNKYFTCIVAPRSHSGEGTAAYVVDATAFDGDGSQATTEDMTFRLVTRSANIAPGQSLSYPAEVYIGQKEHNAFRSVPEYNTRNYYFQIAKNFGFCTFGWLVELMVWLLDGIHDILPNYGIAIIILVLIVRTLLHPITKRGQVNMVRMQKQQGELQPKIEEAKKKFANDKARLQQETMQIYRASGISPASQLLTCLPMFIQMPIWVALWISLNNNVEMRHQPFVFWIQDMAAPDALYTFSSPLIVPLLGWHIASFNLLPILMAVSMYLQQRLQPKAAPNPNMTQQQQDQQEMMKRMMPLMSIMMLIFFYKGPSGLTLYIFTSSLFGTIEQHRIRKHIKQHEEAGTLLKPRREKPLEGKISKLPRWLQRLQKRIEEAQKVQRSQRAKPKQ